MIPSTELDWTQREKIDRSIQTKNDGVSDSEDLKLILWTRFHRVAVGSRGGVAVCI